MRVCHVGFNYFPGQGLTIFYEFSRHQAKQGVDVIAIAPGRTGEPECEVIDGVKVYRVLIPSIGRFSAGRLKYLWRAARIMRQNKIDLVHTYAFVGAGILPWLAGRWRSVWLYDCQTSAIKPPLLGLQNWLIRIESFSFDAVTVLSEGIRDIVFGPGRRVAAIVPLGADLDRFRPMLADPILRARYAITDKDCVFTYCGTLDHNRKMEKLLSAFAFVAEREPTAKLLVIGDGTAIGELKSLTRNSLLDSRVIFIGFVPYAEIPAHLAITTVALAFISMDACFEHQPPTKTVEYLSQGLPVIATDTAGNREFVVHNVNGLLCRDSAESCGQAMLDMVRDSEHRQRLSAAARDSVRSFAWGEIIRTQVIPCYRELLRDQRLAK